MNLEIPVDALIANVLRSIQLKSDLKFVGTMYSTDVEILSMMPVPAVTFSPMMFAGPYLQSIEIQQIRLCQDTSWRQETIRQRSTVLILQRNYLLASLSAGSLPSVSSLLRRTGCPLHKVWQTGFCLTGHKHVAEWCQILIGLAENTGTLRINIPNPKTWRMATKLYEYAINRLIREKETT
jgi:hypothetical protein